MCIQFTPMVHGAGQAPLGRQATLFAAMAALTQRLSAVFTPYFPYALDGLVACLTAQGPPAPDQPRKKRRKSQEAGAAAAQAPAVLHVKLQVTPCPIGVQAAHLELLQTGICAGSLGGRHLSSRQCRQRAVAKLWRIADAHAAACPHGATGAKSAMDTAQSRPASCTGFATGALKARCAAGGASSRGLGTA